MSDINPYESPQSAAPSVAKPLKQGIGFVAVLLLTPLAVLIAFGCSCAAVTVYVNSSSPYIFDNRLPLLIWLAWLIFLVPPSLTLMGMAIWLRRSYLAHKGFKATAAAQEKDPSQSRGLGM